MIIACQSGCLLLMKSELHSLIQEQQTTWPQAGSVTAEHGDAQRQGDIRGSVLIGVVPGLEPPQSSTRGGFAAAMLSAMSRS